MSGPERFRAPVAVHLFFLREDSILLLRRAGTGYQDGYYSVPAGHLDGDESVTAAAIREAREETGIDLEAGVLGYALVMHRREEEERIDFFLATREWTGEPANCEPQKCDDLSWHSTSALPSNMVPYVRASIEGFLAGERFLEFGWPDR